MSRIAVIAFLVLLLFNVHAQGQDTQASPSTRPKIGLVLSGGGAKGAAHVGVIKVLERLGVPIDYIAGTSMGSIVGGLYASGLSADELDQAIRAIDWEDIFHDKPPRAHRDFRRKLDDEGFLIRYKFGYDDDGFQFPRGIINGQKLNLALRKLAVKAAGIHDFDNLSIPFRAVATDIVTGQRVTLSSGDLSTAMRASMAVPGIFPPVKVNGQLLVDGMLADNLPMDVAREMGADILIVVDFKEQLRKENKLNSGISILAQSLDILILQNSRNQLKTLRSDDVYINLDMGDVDAGSFDKAVEAIPIGEKGAQSVISKLRRLASLRGQAGSVALSSSSPSPRLAPDPAPDPKPIIIDFIRIDNKSRLSDELITSRLTVRIGDRLDFDQLDRDLAKIYGLDYFETVDFLVVMEGDRSGIVVTATEKAEGLNSFRFGLNLENDFDGDSAYNVSVRYQREGVNELGGEFIAEATVGEKLALSAAFLQPLDPATRYFISSRFSYLARNVPTFENGDVLGEFRVNTVTARLAGTRQFGSWGALSLGLEAGHGWQDVNSGPASLESKSFGIGKFFTKFQFDTLDNVNFPVSGVKGGAEFTRSTSALGGESSYNIVTGGGLVSKSWGRSTVLLAARSGVSYDGVPSTDSLFELGGFLRLSGFQTDQLTGQNFGLGNLIFYYNFGAKQGSFGVPIYLGASLETGNVWERRGDMEFGDLILAGSAFVGLDTPVGPLYLAFGHAEGGENSLYLFLGQTF